MLSNVISINESHTLHYLSFFHTWLDARTSSVTIVESGSWDTSKALVRRTLEQCINMGRQHRAQGRKQDEYEAYRLLGQAVRLSSRPPFFTIRPLSADHDPPIN